MGIGPGSKISSSSFDSGEEKLPNPDPNNYEILREEQLGKYLIMVIKYPDCTNYEGKKILVFKDIDSFDLMEQKSIDPHFSENEKFHSPIARFVPTPDGYKLAVYLCKMLTIQEEEK